MDVDASATPAQVTLRQQALSEAIVEDTTAPEHHRDRFFNRWMLLALSLYALFALTFSYFQVKGDGTIYFNLLRAFFGEEVPEAVAYQFGSDFWNTPFFLVGKLFASIFGLQPKIFHVTFEELSITLATNAALIVTLYFGWRILSELNLPRHAGVLFLTVAGTPLLYYTVFEPSSKHAVDTLVLTMAAFVFLQVATGFDMRMAAVLGVLVAWSVNIRWANAPLFLVLAISLVLRGRAKQACVGAAVAFIVAPLMFAIPALRGIPYLIPSYFPPDQSGAIHIAAAADLMAAPAPEPFDWHEEYDNPLRNFDPAIPLKMLVSEHRGIFLWTPLTAFATLGFALALVRLRRASLFRSFLLPLGLGYLALLCSHVLWGQWNGGFAFSQRFLTGLFPLFLIGVAELLRRVWVRWVFYPLLIAATGFSLFVAFVHDIGYDAISERDGLVRHLEAGWAGRHNLRLDIQDDAKARWEYAWGLVNGRDPECVHGCPPGE